MGSKDPAIPAATIALYEALIATCPEAERKGATNPYTSRNGHMFSFLGKDGKLALRLPAEEREAFMKRYRTKPCVAHGTVMKEYVAVPSALLEKTRELKPYFALGHDYVGSLKPKPTTRKKAAASKKKASKKKAARKKTSAKKTASKKRAVRRKAAR